MKKFVFGLFALLLTICLVGCVKKPQTFYKKGFKIEVPASFEEIEKDNWDIYIENDEYAIMSNRVSKLSNITDDSGNKINLAQLPLNIYFQLILSGNGIEDCDTYFVEGYNCTFYYCYYTVGEKYGYMMMVAESESFFYTINIATAYDSYKQSKQQMFEYAISIELD